MARRGRLTDFGIDVGGDKKIQMEDAPHTRIKHDLLKDYLGAWYNIISSSENKLVYIDGFSGSGIYEDKPGGSPIIAIECLLKHVLNSRLLDSNKSYQFYLIEEDPDRAACLHDTITNHFGALPSQVNKKIIEGTFEQKVDEILKAYGETNLPPAFAFIDPYGYSDCSMETISRLMSNRKCEVFINFMSGFINRFINADEWPEPIMNRLFGTDAWKPIRTIRGTEDRLKAIRKLYKDQLIEQAKARYVLSFEMIGEMNQVIYDLVFATKSITGLNAMKEAMWRIDPRGTNRFSDITDVGGQTFLTQWVSGSHWLPQAQEQVFKKFHGRSVPFGTLFEHVVIETPYPYRAAIINGLKDEKKVRVLNGGPRGGITKDCTFVFS